MTDDAECAIAAAEAALERARAAIAAEMRAYPTPISGCDAQYVRLVADRARVAAALAALRNIPFVATPRALEPAGA